MQHMLHFWKTPRRGVGAAPTAGRASTLITYELAGVDQLIGDFIREVEAWQDEH
jgi:hypothetical protein